MPPFDDLEYGATLRGLLPGQRMFGRFELVRILGRGGMGVVWLARDTQLNEEVALKFLPDELLGDAGAMEELKRETRRSRALTHQNVVRIHDFFQEGGVGGISMEYVDGDTLSNLRYLEERRCFEVSELREWMRQICEALTYAHEEAKLAHRDLKPANLMVTRGGKVKVTDFGISSSIQESASRVTARSTSGTLVYMSPQQLMGEAPCASDDVYALGATLYDLLTGKPPFYSGNVDLQIREKVPVRMRVRREQLEVGGREEIPESWEATVAACLAKEAAARPQSAREVAQRLGLGGGVAKESVWSPPAAPVEEGKFVISGAVGPTGAGVLEKPKVKGAAIGMLVAGVSVLACGVWWVGVESPRQEAEVKQAAEDAAQKAVVVENSLGMRFVPAGTQGVLFGVWDVRVKDYDLFEHETGATHDKPTFTQRSDHPVVGVSWEDAKSFCRWLTERERKEGNRGERQEYRLPKDVEWSAAVGSSKFPWGEKYPPPQGAGNYGSVISVDSYERTSPVGAFSANRYGLYDMGGNVWQWCEDYCRADMNEAAVLKRFPVLNDHQGGKTFRVLRGASWNSDESVYLLSSSRFNGFPTFRNDYIGFRCVLAVGSSAP